MHSSRMRTAHLLSVSQHALRREGGVHPSMHWAGGVYPSMHYTGGVSQHALGCLPGGVVCPEEGCLPRGFCRGMADTPCER